MWQLKIKEEGIDVMGGMVNAVDVGKGAASDDRLGD